MALDTQKLIGAGAALVGAYVISNWAASMVIDEDTLVGKVIVGGATAGATAGAAAWLTRQGRLSVDDYVPVAMTAAVGAIALRQMLPGTGPIAGRYPIGFQPIGVPVQQQQWGKGRLGF